MARFMGSFEEKTSRTLEREYDVSVIGGSLSGFAAARACGNAGINTLLVERRPVLGWESTWGFALDFIESKSEAVRWLAAVMKAKGGLKNGRLDASIMEMELELERELANCGASLLYYSLPVALAMDEEGVGGVVIGGKEGELMVRASAFIDTTDNAFLIRYFPSRPVERTLFRLE